MTSLPLGLMWCMHAFSKIKEPGKDLQMEHVVLFLFSQVL